MSRAESKKEKEEREREGESWEAGERERERKKSPIPDPALDVPTGGVGVESAPRRLTCAPIYWLQPKVSRVFSYPSSRSG